MGEQMQEDIGILREMPSQPEEAEDSLEDI